MMLLMEDPQYMVDFVARKKAKKLATVITNVLLGITFFYLAAVIFVSYQLESKLNLLITVSPINISSPSSEPSSTGNYNKSFGSPSFTADSFTIDPALINQGGFVLPTNANSSKQSDLLRSGMTIGDVDTLHVSMGDRIYNVPARSDAEEYLITGYEQEVYPLPFYVRNSRIVFNGTLHDIYGKPFATIRNDTVSMKNNYVPTGILVNTPAIGVLFSANPYNVIVTDPYGNIVLCLRRALGLDESYVQFQGYIWSKTGKKMLLVGSNQSQILGPLSQDKFYPVYQRIGVTAPTPGKTQQVLRIAGPV